MKSSIIFQMLLDWTMKICVSTQIWNFQKGSKYRNLTLLEEPLAHLKAYCDQLVGAGKNEALLMGLFSRILNGETLELFASQEMKQWSSWNALAKDFIEKFAYNVEIVPDRYSLRKLNNI